jgi:hypothetical protein
MTKTSFTPEPDEKLVPTMIYTHQRLIWGKLIVKKVIRVSILLQTEMAPKYMDLRDVQVLMFGAGNKTETLKFPLLHVENTQIIAYHILPPADESPYYEVNEPNRKMEKISALAGIFRFNGAVRIAQQSDLKTFLGVQKGNFLPIFDATLTCPLLPLLQGIKTPYMLVRQGETLFSGQ